MPQKPLLELQRDWNLPQNVDWSGVHAIARAQQVESALMRDDERQNRDIHCRNQRQSRGELNDGVRGFEMVGDIPQGSDDTPLVERARDLINTWMGVAP